MEEVMGGEEDVRRSQRFAPLLRPPPLRSPLSRQRLITSRHRICGRRAATAQLRHRLHGLYLRKHERLLPLLPPRPSPSSSSASDSDSVSLRKGRVWAEELINVQDGSRDAGVGLCTCVREGGQNCVSIFTVWKNLSLQFQQDVPRFSI